MKVAEARNRIRLQQKTEMIQNCLNSGMRIAQWCEQNGISLGSYYYWLHKIRKGALEKKEFIKIQEENAVVQIDLPAIKSHGGSIRMEYGEIVLEIPFGTSSSDVASILKAVKETC